MGGSIDFRTLFEAAPDALLVLSPTHDFPVLAASDAYLRASRRERQELIGRPLFEIFPYDSPNLGSHGGPTLRASLDSVLQTGQPHGISSATNTPVRDRDGRILYILHRMEDVRALDLAETNRGLQESNRALKVSEELLRKLAETGTFGLMTCDIDGNISYMNPALRSLLGYTVEDLEAGSARWDRMTPAAFRELDEKAIRELRERGTCTPFEKVYVATDGRRVPVLVGASLLQPAGEGGEVVAFVLDLTERDRAQELLAASEARGRKVIESLPQLVWSCRSDGQCTYLSPQWVRYTGIPEQEQLGLRWLDLVMHPNDRDLTYRAWMSAVEGKAPYDLEYRLRRHDGVYRWFKTRGTPLLNEHGEIVEWFGTCTDIDDQIRSQQEILQVIEERESQWREFDTALSNTSDLTYTFDLEGCFTYANKATLKLLRRSLPEVRGKNFHELDYPFELARTLQEQVQTVIRTGKPLRAETPFTDPSGETREYEYIFVPVFAGENVEAVTGSTRDITERKRTEEGIRESEQRLRFALQFGRMKCWEYQQGEFEHADRVPDAPGGDAVEAWNDRTLRRLLMPDDAARVERMFAESLRDGLEVDTELRVVAAGHEDRWIWVRGAPNPGSETQPRLSGLISDVTERRSMDERLRESARLESVGVLAGGIAHDFNNLLTGILGNASLAMSEIGKGHPVFPFLEGVMRASESAATLTNQMLAYSGRGRFVVRRLELSATVGEVSLLIKASIPRHVSLHLDLHSNLPDVQVDVTQMHQVIMNLIVNAAEAIPSGQQGEVTVRTFERALGEADLTVLRNSFDSPPGRYIALTVEDNGTGMDRATQERIFDPFFTTKFTGRGLGLSAVLGILRGHKGAIGIESQVGIGTRISVYLPVAAPAEVPAGPPSSASFDPAKQGTVLIVDDEATVRTVATTMLRRAGYKVLTVNDGEEAVRLFRERHADLVAVLLDLSMPVMDGELALPLLREIDPGVPIVLSTGYSDVEAAGRFASTALAGVLQKPYTAVQLQQALARAIAGDRDVASILGGN